MPDTVFIPGPDVTLEGRFLPGAGGSGVVITHPHPLFGGSMNNNVVWTAERAFHTRGFATLCFNFRGVNRSTGTYGGGEAEVADVAAALDFLRPGAPARTTWWAIPSGPSWRAGPCFRGLPAQGAVFIAPPINFMDLSWLPRVPVLRLVVAGDRDDLCPLADLRRLLAAKGEAPAATPEISIIAGTDHFFGGREDKLFQVLRDFPL